ncbi:alkanesulfonate transporter substrate-binding subunit [Geobacter sp. OR-1]|uniref:ABC transporter substrate-binding protein n=1 Tax=Geobacter sp. OR-1 TaxID=1266765 RepID=UPI000541F9A1|nr:ABC transporter substrate-binding protein [Geobacter sp. OR-1]GAM10279.1 alkanesulfonate transporter substrate-binding subunit [Geobacter sp. OR-1]
MKTTKIIILAVAVAIAGGGWFLTSKESHAEKEVAIKVGESTTTPNSFELAQKLTGRDILKEEEVSLERIPIQGGGGGTVTMQALLAGNIDVAGGSISVWVNAISKGAKVKLLFPGSATEKPEHSGLLVLEESNIHTIKDLVGKKIAVNVLGAEADFIIRTFLKQNCLSINQVELVVVPAENQEQVLRSRQADAVAWTTSGGAQFDRALDKGGVRRIPGTSSFETRGNLPLLTTSEGFREEFIKEHPGAVRKYLKAVDAARYIVWGEYQKNPDRVRAVYAEITEAKGGNPEQANYYRGPRWSPENQFIADRDIQFWIEKFTETGILKPGQIKPSDIYTNEFNPKYKNI